LEFALTDPDGQSREELLASTIEELDRVTNMLTMSLDVSEANAHALRLHKQSVELDGLVERMFELYEPAFSDAGLLIRLDRGSAAVTLGDSALLQRAITNLFDNEIKHLPSGSTVTISVLQNNDTCILEIEDDGPGFSKELLPKVFEPYVRSEGSGGHGLGLAFVAATIRSHGGTITVKNRNPEGAIISICLPIFAGQ
jgi:signal transduction histidine kinase